MPLEHLLIHVKNKTAIIAVKQGVFGYSNLE